MGEVIVTIVWEAELEDLAADVFREGAGEGVEVAIAGGGVGQGWVEGVLVGEPGDGVVVVVDADEDAVVGVGGAGAREEAEGREVAGLAAAASSSSSSHICGGGGNGGGGRGGGWVRVLGFGEAVHGGGGTRGAQTRFCCGFIGRVKIW